MPAIQVENLTRVYKSGRGIRSISLTVEEGEVFGFLGPNGAGKTTAIRTLLGFLTPQSGRVEILGMNGVTNSREVRRRVGYLPSDPALYDFLTGAQNIEFALRVRGVKDRSRARQLMERLEIDPRRRLKTLSRGNKQKLAIVVALAHDPDLIIMDEPTSGLDPLVQEKFAELIREERSRGKSVLMSSHVLSEVEHLCDRVGVIRDGQIVTVSGVEALRKQRIKYVTCRFEGSVPTAEQLPDVRNWQADGNRVSFTLSGSIDSLVGALARYSLSDLTVTDPPLEEVFRAFYEGGSPA